MSSSLCVIAVLRTADVIRIIGSLLGAVVLFGLCLAVVVYLLEQGKKAEPCLQTPALPPPDVDRFDVTSGASGMPARDVMSLDHETGVDQE